MADDAAKSSQDKKSTEFDDLPPTKEGNDAVKGGVAGRVVFDKPACSTGGMSTCKVADTSVNFCDTLSGCK